MKHLSRVVWTEGMYLGQHHFQVQSRYFEDSLHFALGHLFFKGYGVAGCQLDAEALRNGTVVLVHARGVMPDGLPFDIPASDPAPPARRITDLFSPTQESHVVFLGIPARRIGGANTASEGTMDQARARYIARTTVIPDESTGGDEQPVIIGRKNFTLRLDHEADGGEVSLPIARVRRDGAGQFEYDPAYVPPCLQIGASEQLLALVGRLLGMLEQKSGAMAAERKGGGKALRDFASQEVANFWLLHAVRSGMAPLRHLLQVKSCHPEALFVEMSRLAGALCTFALDADPRTLPLYDHDRLGECFLELDRQIRRHLEIVIPTNCLQIPLEQVSEFMYVARVIDQRCFGRAHWILGVQSDADRAQVLSRVPSLVKICSSKHVERLYKEALPGLTLHHLPSPPPAVSPRLGSEYFAIGRTGSHTTQVCWSAIDQSHELGVYVPGALRGAELELFVVLEG